MSRKNQKQVAIWLFSCCFMVFVMVVVGGYTRLTSSGLSIVEWQPVTGFIPPMNETEWNSELNKYKQSPEYQKINKGMKLEEFKGIFWVEYTHRLLGRITGFVFFVPFLFFLMNGMLKKSLIIKLSGIFILGGMQGVMGWYMVASGLVDRTDVSHLRLTAHLLLAFIIYSLIFWMALEQFSGGRKKSDLPKKIRTLSIIITGIIFIQVIFGGMVAGMNAGLIYNTFPLMDGRIIPDGIFFHSPLLVNFVENPTTIQFMHRAIGVLIAVLVIYFWIRVNNSTASTAYSRIIVASHILLVVIFIQITLGILTLINMVPLSFALIHQAFALILLSVSLFINQKLCIKVNK